MKTSSELRAEARAALTGNWGIIIGITVVYSIIMGAISTTGVGNILLGGAFLIGLTMVMLNLVRGEEIKFETLFAGFSTGNFTATIGLYVRTGVCLVLWSMLFVIPGIVKSFSYAMAPYILADHPELTGKEAIEASMTLMNGKKWQLFCLNFSFIGWALLTPFTFGLILLWLVPYIEAANAAFYESIKDEIEVLHVDVNEAV